jgi:small subunit ribosomal protein S8
MDPISDILIRIKNAYLAQLKTVSCSHSRPKESLIKLLVANGYLRDYEVVGEKAGKVININLKYEKKVPAMADLKIISKPSLRIYTHMKKIKAVFGGRGINVLSTSKGLMTGQEARKANLGGELICQVW